MNYNEVIVVEGKNDKARILALYPDIEVITTNGSEISNETLDLISEVSKTKEVILFLDPDYPGERIRSLINNRVPNCKQAFIEKKKAIDERKHKVGVEHASFEDLKEALDNLLSPSEVKGSLKISDLYNLGLIDGNNSSLKRKYLSERLHLGNPNGKTLLKRLNCLNKNVLELEAILNEKDWDSTSN